MVPIEGQGLLGPIEQVAPFFVTTRLFNPFGQLEDRRL
jgi:hypothetical protein